MILPLALVGAQALAAGKLQYNRDVRPILNEKCFHCHGTDANHRKGDLRLDLREAATKPAKSGDIEKLRPIVEAQDPPPEFSFNDVADPVAHLKSLSGDPEGREILAVLLEVLEAGYVHVDAGTPDEMYIWPYFARYPVDKLSPQQLVELFRIVFAGDYEDMKTYGTYLSYRAGITPAGSFCSAPQPEAPKRCGKC